MSNKKRNLGGVKNDEGKAPINLIPPAPLIDIAKVFEFGVRKYGLFNYKKGMKLSRLYDAMMRHMLAWNDGEDVDPESKMTHVAHAGCCLLMLSDAMIKGYGHDDRYQGEEKT